MNKNEINSKIKNLEKEIDDLKKLVNEEIIDLFSITTYSQVCKKLNIVEKTESDFDNKKEFAFYQLQNISKLYNGSNEDNYYYPYFSNNNNTLVFFGSFCDDGSYGGQIAYYKDNKTSDYIGKTFIEIYENLL